LSSLKELESVITLCAEGDELDGLDPPIGWEWEKEISEFEQFAVDNA
jgi:hypothetical protein